MEKINKKIMMGAVIAFVMVSASFVMLVSDNDDVSAAAITSAEFSLDNGFVIGTSFSTVSVASSAPYTVFSTTWQKATPGTSTWANLTATDTVPINDHMYRVNVALAPQTGDSFATGGGTTVKVKIGSAAAVDLTTTFTTTASRLYNMYIYYIPTGDAANTVRTSIEYPSELVLKDTMDVTVANIALGTAFPTAVTVPSGAKYTATITWQKLGATSWSNTSDATPTTGNMYRGSITLQPLPGYEFDRSIELSVKVNGTVAMTKTANSTTSYSGVLYYPSANTGATYLPNTATSSIVLKNPAAGITNADKGDLPITLPANLTVYSMTFTYGNTAQGVAPLEAGKAYSIVVVLELTGSFFDDRQNYIVDYATTTVGGGSRLTVTFEKAIIPYAPIVADDVQLALPDFVYGKNVSTYVAESKNSMFAVTTAWYLSGSSTPLSADTKFAKDTDYVLEVTLASLKSYLIFDDATDFSDSVDGIDSYDVKDGNLVLSFTSVEGVDAPPADDNGSGSTIIVAISVVAIIAILAVVYFVFVRKG